MCLRLWVIQASLDCATSNFNLISSLPLPPLLSYFLCPFYYPLVTTSTLCHPFFPWIILSLSSFLLCLSFPSCFLSSSSFSVLCLFFLPLQPSDFSISLKAAGKNKHFKVQLSEGAYCIGQRRFNTMDELVEHYKKAPIFTSEHGDKLYLVKPLL